MNIKPITLTEEVNPYDDLWFASQLQKSSIDLQKNIPFPETIISIGTHTYKGEIYPTAVMTAGEFSVISAPPKSKKSFFKSQLCASYIGGNASNYFPQIRGHRKTNCTILDLDTEQSPFYAQRTFKRVERIVNASYPNYKPFKMRHLNPSERVAFIENLLEYYKNDVKLVFIDGVADLIEDTNDLTQSNYIAGKLLKWTDTYNIHICTIIHTAHGTSKPTGHLGSTLTKKAETVFQLNPLEKSPNVEVIHQFSRGRSFDTFEFYMNENQALIYATNSYENVIENEQSNQKNLPKISPEEAFDVPY